MNSAAGPAATLGRLWAVARLTLMEAVRRRVFVLLLIFGAAIVSSATFFPAIDATARLRLIEVWSVRAALLFSVIVSIFLAGFSLPGDFETRRVYTLVTKPVHRMTVFGGKFLGFFMLLAVFLLSMAVLSVAYIRVVSLLSKDFPELKAEPRFFAEEVRGLGRPNDDFMKFGDSGRFGARNKGSLAWTFRGLSRSDFGPTMRVQVKANLGRTGQQFALEGAIVVRAINAQTRARAEQRVDTFHTNQETPVEFDAALIGEEGELEIEVAPGEPDLLVDADRQGAVIFGASRNFEINFLKGMLLVLFQSTVVMAITLAGSTRFTAPVAIVLGIKLYLVGMMWGHIAEGVRDIDVQMEQYRIQMAQGRPQQARTPEDLPPWLLKVSTAVSKVTLKAVPDFGQFNFSDYLLNDHAVMAADLAGGFAAMMIRVAVLVGIGLLLMLSRDFAS